MENHVVHNPESAGLQERIKTLIVSGEFEMGEKISEDQLAKRFATGKATIRHALAGLAAVGLIQVRPRIGTFIFSLDASEFDRLNELREILECAAVRIAMRSNHQMFLIDLRKNVDRAGALNFRDNYYQAYRILDREFHRLPFAHAKNKYLTDAYEAIEIKIWAMRSLLTFPDDHFEKSLDAHRTIVTLLESGRVEDACQRLQTHIQKSFSTIEKNLLGSN
ncbi:AsnC family transcriptional regulator [Pandoraea terrae]|uniref:AsnC family transcriptional regulator n=1 Tax=Pandoraea terrae TaxID=1537710 RepID=A0A5E4Y5E3_9BURK|nr:GntR family transcriptional regulator [Pandoraea terrae]VVE43886.1 AsnC family transcriptional regulator [Pandoraea terrae]